MKLKFSKKTLIWLSAAVFLILITSFLYFDKQKKEEIRLHQEEVKEHYKTYMKAIEDTLLYRKEDNQWQESGFLYKDAPVELSNIEEDYYQIKSTNYYVYYKNLKGEDNQLKIESYPNVLWDIDIKTSIPTVLIDGGVKKYSLDISIQAPVMRKEKNYYTILLNNKTYEIATENIEEEIKTTREIATCKKIPVLFFQEEDNLEERVKYLKEENYTFILERDLLDFLEQKILLPEKTVMIVQKEENNLTKLLANTYQVPIQTMSTLTKTYQDKDVLTSPENPNAWYQITSQTTTSRFQDMLLGKKQIVYVAQQIPVLNYHFFYDEKTEQCNETICLEKKNFMAQLAYLKENNYKTLTMQEFNDWLDKKIELPKKSVLLTIDDGAMGTDTHLPELLNQYDLKATLFLITGWWPISKYTTGNLEIQSHGHELHHNNFCANGKCGMKGLLLSQEEIEADLRQSKEIIGNSIAFCYPFYAYNETLTQAVKNNFSLAFVGGNKKASRNSDKYKIPRYIIYKDTSLENFKKMLNS